MDEAMLCLENLAVYLDFIACCYSEDYEEHTFTADFINKRKDKIKQNKQEAADTQAKIVKQQEDLVKHQQELEQKELDLKKLMSENESLKEELSKRRQEQQPTYVPKPLDLSEYRTRKIYIDSMLIDAGWVEGKN